MGSLGEIIGWQLTPTGIQLLLFYINVNAKATVPSAANNIMCCCWCIA
jgi:hypothetical protein